MEENCKCGRISDPVFHELHFQKGKNNYGKKWNGMEKDYCRS